MLEVYNDLNGNLVNLFRCAKYHSSELQREISGYFNARETFEDLKERLQIRGFTDIQRSAMFYVLIKISYGADGRTFGCNKKNLTTDYLDKISLRLQNIIIENKDFENLIHVYDRPGALFYCDPPYYKAEQYYDAAFSAEDHQRLKQCLSGIYTVL